MKACAIMKNVVYVLFVGGLLSGCAIMPRGSSWESPKRYTNAQVFNAAIQAGGHNGYATTSSDRESGTMSFTKKIGKGDMILSVQVVNADEHIVVRTTANYAGDLAIMGLHEEAIRIFHDALFRNLNIVEPSERNNVRIEVVK